MNEFVQTERENDIDVDAEVKRLKIKLTHPRESPSFSQEQLKNVAVEVWGLLKNKEVHARLHNEEALQYLKLSKEEREKKGVTNGLFIPGGGLSCIAAFGIFRALIEKGILKNIDEIIASSGGSWVAAYGISALSDLGSDLKTIRIAVSVFARDLRDQLFINSNKIKVLWNTLRGKPIADLQRVKDLVAGNVFGAPYRPNDNERDPRDKGLDINAFRKAAGSIGFNIAVTNIETGNSEYLRPEDLSDDQLFDALYASSSTPRIIGQTTPNLKGKRYSDGDPSVNPTQKFTEMGVTSAIVSLNRPIDHKLTKRMPKFIEKLIFSGQVHSEKLRQQFRQLDVNYLMNILNMIEYGKNNNLYVFEPDPKDEIDMKDISDRSHKKLYNLYFSMYKKIKRRLRDL